MNKRNSTNALLQKASAQLRGEFVTKNEEENELDAYISSLTQKTQQRKSVNFEDESDICISSDIDDFSAQDTPRSDSAMTGSKFFKKPVPKQPQVGSGSKFLKKSQNAPPVALESGSKFLKKPAAKIPGDVVSSQNMHRKNQNQWNINKAHSLIGQRSSMVNKTTAAVSKIKPKPATVSNVYSFDTDSDESMSLSGLRSSRLEMRPGSSSSDSVKIGRDGGKFLKKKKEEPRQETIETKPKMKAGIDVVPTKKSSKFVSRTSLKYPANVVLSSEEESLAEFMEHLERAESRINKMTSSIPEKLVQNFEKKPASSPIKRTTSPDAKPPVARRTPSPSSRTPTPRRSVSPHVHRSPRPRYSRSRSSSDDSNFGESLISEVADPDDFDGNSVSSGGEFKVNLMDIDSLEPVPDLQPSFKKETSVIKKKKFKEADSSQHKPKKKKGNMKGTYKTNDLFGLHTVDELLGNAIDDDKHIVSTDNSEVHTEYSEKTKPIKTSNDIFHSKPKSDNITDVFGSEQKTKKYASLFDSNKRDRDTLDVFGSKHKHGEMISEMESEIKTGDSVTPRVYSYTEDFEETIDEKIGVSSHAALKKSRDKDKKLKCMTDDEYSEDFTDDADESDSRTYSGSDRSHSDSYSDQSDFHTDSKSLLPRKAWKPVASKSGKPVETKSAIVQTGEEVGLHFQWGSVSGGYPLLGPHFGLGFVDPTPIATHVVGADALEAMTSYSPSMLALHDMMKQQLQLTREFIQSQQIMYRCFVESVESNFKYTTLAETKEYIRKNKKKKLTFDEALKLVESEMDR